MIQIHSKSRYLLLILFALISQVRCVRAQYFNSWPLYATACEVDTDCVKYAAVQATYQIDSTYEKGILKETDVNTYNREGIILHCTRQEIGLEKRREETAYEFDKNQICVFHSTYIVNDSDTVGFTSFRSLYYDSVASRYSYECRVGPDRAGARDSVWDDLSIRFVDSKCKIVWVNGFINRYVVEVQEVKGSPISTTRIYGFRNEDTLYSQVIISGAGQFPVDTITTYFADGERAQTVMFNGRITETKLTKNGEVLEFHTYKEQVANGRVIETKIFNRLTADTVPEILIMYSDSAIVVRKGKLYPLIDNNPEPVFYDDEQPPIAPAPTLETMFPYKKSKILPNGLTQIEYYNFYSGTIKPLLIIQKDDRGIVHAFITNDWVCRRIVK